MGRNRRDTGAVAHACPSCAVVVLGRVDIVFRNFHSDAAPRIPYSRPWNPRRFPAPHIDPVEHPWALESRGSAYSHTVGKAVPHQHHVCPPSVDQMMQIETCRHAMGLL